jgi:hypothetical protein
MPILFRNPDDKEGFYPGDCYLEDDQWLICGKKGYAAVCVAGGDTIPEARNKVYGKLSNIVVANAMMRFDIGETTEMSLSSIKNILSHESVSDMQKFDVVSPRE